MRKPEKTVLIYDGDCAFCTRSANIMKRWAKNLEVVASQTAGALESHPGLSRAGVKSRVYLMQGKRLFGGAEAVARVIALRKIGGGALIYYFPPLRIVADAVYDFVARNRKHLGCGDSCSLK